MSRNIANLEESDTQTDIDILNFNRYTIALFNDTLESLSSERDDTEAENETFVRNEHWPFQTLPEHLLEGGWALDILNDIISLKIEKLQCPERQIAIDLPTELDEQLIDPYKKARLLFDSIPPQSQAEPHEGNRELFPVLFSLAIPQEASQIEIYSKCRNFEKIVTRHQRYLSAYEWTFSQDSIAATIAEDELPVQLLCPDCIRIYRKDIKKRIGNLLLDYERYWVPSETNP